MTKTDIQNALLNAYLKRDNAQDMLDAAQKEITALRNMLAGVNLTEQAKTPSAPPPQETPS